MSKVIRDSEKQLQESLFLAELKKREKYPHLYEVKDSAKEKTEAVIKVIENLDGNIFAFATGQTRFHRP